MEKYLPEDCIQAYKELMEETKPEKINNLPVTEWKGHFMGQLFPAETVKFVYENWTPRENDILIASFMKTGTTWAREIVKQLLFGDDSELLEISKELSVPLIYLEAGKSHKYKVLDNLPLPRRYFVTHLPPALLNMERFKKNNVKIILMLRNPKDQAVSYFHFVSNLPYKKKTIDRKFVSHKWDEQLEEVASGLHPVGMKRGEWYLDYIKHWWPYTKNENVLTVFYEDLIKENSQEIRRIAEHLNVKVDESKVKSVSHKSSFSIMSQKSENPGHDETNRHEYNFLRKGGIGGWKKHFTVEKSEVMDQQIKEKLQGLDINFVFEE